MDLIQLSILALIQGVTEFLPISSSAHLLLPHHLLGWQDQGLAFDTAVHFGSLVAVLIYFRADILTLTTALMNAAISRQHSADSRFAVNLLIACVPVLAIGFFGRVLIEQELRSLEVIIGATIIFAIVLLAADLTGKRERPADHLDVTGAILIGLSQCVALIPGASRSGVTMTMALMLGFSREGASRISFLISIPVISGACLLKMIDLATSGHAVDWVTIFAGATAAGLSAYFCIRLFLGFIERIGFMPFIVYRLILGVVLLGFL